ncbi:MAG: 4'-phosphopantetheinyl transferase superfamily protein [Clostridiales bacterium]|jgi:4'-phosphopantetheinyl transferase|nr:4'-phosphopantetheinyl transferase superfamily protein [Clostridiales bacterium]
MKALYFAELSSEIDTDLFSNLLGFVSHEKKRKILRLRFDIDKKLSLYSEVLVRCLACRTLNIENSHIMFMRRETGKPFLKGYPEFHYNISHTKNALAVGISKEPVGVDIERIRQADLRIARRFFSEDEILWIEGTETERDRRFFSVWTKKEAWLKRLGQGISQIRSVDVLSDKLSGLLFTTQVKDYMLSVCSAEVFDESCLIILSEADIIDMRNRQRS